MSIKENIPEVPTLTNVTDILVFDRGSNKVKRIKKTLLDAEYQNESSTYLIYRALLTQTGTSNPTAIVLENTLGGTPVWTRGVAGIYTCTLADAFPFDSTFILNGSNSNGGTPFFTSIEMGIGNSFILYTTDRGTGLNSDALLSNNPIEILVYL